MWLQKNKKIITLVLLLLFLVFTILTIVTFLSEEYIRAKDMIIYQTTSRLASGDSQTIGNAKRVVDNYTLRGGVFGTLAAVSLAGGIYLFIVKKKEN